MGYDDQRRGGNDRYGSGREPHRGGYDDQGRGDRGRAYGRGDQDDRGFIDRAGDEVRSWFGDEEAERRRHEDERNQQRDGGDRYRGQSYGRGDDRSASYGGQQRGRDGYDDRDRDRDRDVTGYGWGRPGASDQDRGRANRFQAGGARQGQGQGSPSPHDHNYSSWRDRQMQAFDRDYDEYRRDNQSKFESEFTTYRTRRQGQRELIAKVTEHQEVVGSDGQHVGKVDHVQGDRIKLAKNDQAAGGHHHTIPSSWIESVDEKVTIGKTADEAHRLWREEKEENDRSGGGLFGRRDESGREEGISGDHNLNRSFSGTY